MMRVMDDERFVVKVGRKGQITIPVEIKRRLGIRDRVVMKVEENEIRIMPLIPLEELFGADGETMREVAREIIDERLREIRREEEIHV